MGITSIKMTGKMLSHSRLSYDEFPNTPPPKDNVEASDVWGGLTVELKGDCLCYTLKLGGLSTWYSPEVGSNLARCFVLAHYSLNTVEKNWPKRKLSFCVFSVFFFLSSAQNNRHKVIWMQLYGDVLIEVCLIVTLHYWHQTLTNSLSRSLFAEALDWRNLPEGKVW